jgi:hypothetical protein
MAASNLFGYYSGQGQAMPSLSARGQLYQQYGLGQSTGYSGTASQNTALLNALQGGGGSLGLGSSTASTPAPAQSFGTYQPVIDTLTQQAQGLGSIYDPQVTALQASLPTIQQKYSDMLSELSRETGVEQTSLQQEQTGAVGSNQAQAAAAGVAETGGTQEKAAQEAIKSQYGTAIANLLAQSASGQQQLGTQQAQEEQGVNQSIASLLGQESTAKSNIAGQIAQAQASYAAEQEQKREFDAQLAATNAQTAATNAQGLSMQDILSALGGTGATAGMSSQDVQDTINAAIAALQKKTAAPASTGNATLNKISASKGGQAAKKVAPYVAQAGVSGGESALGLPQVNLNTLTSIANLLKKGGTSVANYFGL